MAAEEESMSPVVPNPALGRRLPLHLLLLLLFLSCLSCLFRGTGDRVALTQGGERTWTLLELDQRLDQELSQRGRGLGILAMASRSRALPEAWHEPSFRDAVRAWVDKGGRLLLLGYAAAYAEDLGLAGKPRIGAHVFGRRGLVDTRGSEFGLELPAAFAQQIELPADPPGEPPGKGPREYRLGGGTHGRIEYCLFDEESRGEAKVLGTYYRRKEGKRQSSSMAGLLRWRLGQGAVMALGLAPLSTDEGQSLIAALAQQLGREREGAWVALPVVPPDPSQDRWVSRQVPAPLPPLHEVPGGLIPRLAHYGLAFSPSSIPPATAEELVDLALSEGADLFSVTAREPGMADAKKLGDFIQQKGALLLAPDGESDAASTWLGQIQPDAGRVRDLPLRGLVDPELSKAWPASLFPVLHLDPDPAHGGSPDWLHAQVRDFLRHRDAEASTVVLDLQERMDPRRLSSLLDLLQRPFSSARSYRLAATGKGGQRESLAALLSSPGSFLRASSQAPCRRMVIENRFLRLEGTEGSLIVDRDRASDLTQGRKASQRLSPRFMSTRLRGARPGPEYVMKVRKQLYPRMEDPVDPAQHTLRLPASGAVLPRRISAAGVALVEKELLLPPGTYEIRFKLRSEGRGSLVEIRLDDRVLGFLVCPGGQNRNQVFRFGIAEERRARLALEHRYGESMQLLEVAYEKVEDAGIEVRSASASGPRALVLEEVGSSFLTERRRILTLGDLPALCIEVEYDRVSTGLRVDRFFAFPGYQLQRRERLERGTKVYLRLEDPAGVQPDLILIASGLGRNHELAFRSGEGLAMKSFPRSKGGFRLALVLADELGSVLVDPAELWTALDEVVHPPSLTWEKGERRFAWPWKFVWRRCAILPSKAARPIQLREGGLWRGALPGPSGDQGESLLVAGGPGDVNAVRLGEWIGPKPLPGAARLLAYDSDAGALVLSRLSAICTNPGVRLPEALGSPSLDGELWDYHYADKLWLPRIPGRYRMGLSGESAFRPSLVATTGNVERCRFDEESQELHLVLSDPRPMSQKGKRLFELQIRGPAPRRIRGAVLAHPGQPGPEGRTLLLARPGEIRISFGDPAGPGR